MSAHTTARIAGAYGCQVVEVYHFPEAADRASPVWLRISTPGADAFSCLTLTQAQQLCAGLHEVIAAHLQPATPIARSDSHV
jgi:hypothetical protein